MIMRNKFWLIILTFAIVLLVACGDNKDLNNNLNNDLDGLAELNVEFEVPEILAVGETLVLEAVVTYGDELVEDADEVVFEVWEKGKKDDSDHLDSENNGDGTYIAEVTFDEDGIYEMYAHTTARGIHYMPKREVIVGEGGDYDEEHDEHHSFQTDGFDMHFMEPESPTVDEEIELMTHLMLDEEAFEDLHVRYEIWNDDVPETKDWLDVEETAAGEYTTTYTFAEPGVYNIQIHVEDDEDLHEHVEYEIEVSE